jgi:hypothetical protein
MSSESAASIILDDNSLKIALFKHQQEGRISVPSPLGFYLRKNPAYCRAISVVEKLRTPLATLWPD